MTISDSYRNSARLAGRMNAFEEIALLKAQLALAHECIDALDAQICAIHSKNEQQVPDVY